jgi:hypothetical protein
MREQYTREEFATALLNLEWLTRNPRDDDDGLDVDSWTYVRGDGGQDIDTLTEPGATPATGNA